MTAVAAPPAAVVDAVTRQRVRRASRHRVVVTVLAAANRDPKIFDDPDAFDVHRENAREHLAFSAGRHFCLGAALSRMESEVALRAFFDRFDVELLPGATRRPTRILRGYATRSSQVPRTTQAPRRAARPPSSPP